MTKGTEYTSKSLKPLKNILHVRTERTGTPTEVGAIHWAILNFLSLGYKKQAMLSHIFESVAEASFLKPMQVPDNGDNKNKLEP